MKTATEAVDINTAFFHSFITSSLATRVDIARTVPG
jgi:hypothetical protein